MWTTRTPGCRRVADDGVGRTRGAIADLGHRDLPRQRARLRPLPHPNGRPLARPVPYGPTGPSGRGARAERSRRAPAGPSQPRPHEGSSERGRCEPRTEADPTPGAPADRPARGARLDHRHPADRTARRATGSRGGAAREPPPPRIAKPDRSCRTPEERRATLDTTLPPHPRPMRRTHFRRPDAHGLPGWQRPPIPPGSTPVAQTDRSRRIAGIGRQMRLDNGYYHDTLKKCGLARGRVEPYRGGTWIGVNRHQAPVSAPAPPSESAVGAGEERDVAAGRLDGKAGRATLVATGC